MFVTQENRSPKLSKEQWLQIFLYIDEIGAFFYLFPPELHEWLYMLVDSQGQWRLDSPIVWTPKLVRHLEASESNITWAVDHWIDCILGIFVNYFMIDINISYSEVE